MNIQGTHGAEAMDGAADFALAAHRLLALASGALWWPDRRVLAVADLHLGRSERVARHGNTLLPPYESDDTLTRLESEVDWLNPRIVIGVGDTFDDIAAAGALDEAIMLRLTRLAAGRRLVWIAGNHDPGPVDLPGSYVEEAEINGLRFRHIAAEGRSGPEISAHYHPKAVVSVRGRRIHRRCFLLSGQKLILPAFGTYTGGLNVRDQALADLIRPDAQVLVLDKKVHVIAFDALC